MLLSQHRWRVFAGGITIILGNALDNAIRAAKDSQRKVVDIHIQPQGAYSSIVIANDIAHPVLSDNPALRTTKNIRYRHGFGIQNMRQAVERNQGLIRILRAERPVHLRYFAP